MVTPSSDPESIPHRKQIRLVALGEVLLRLSAPGSQRLLQTPSLEIAVGGAEANVAVSLACLGHVARLVTTLPDQPLGRACMAEIRRHGVDVSAVRFVSHGRVGLYFFEAGAGLRPAEVLYDRAGSSFANMSAASMEWSGVLADADWLHVSGVTPALGAGPTELTLAALRAARARGLRISFDCNYRAKLWQTWGGDAASILAACAAEADLLFADERALAMLLGESSARDFATLTARAFATWPALRWIAATLRVEHSADHHELSGRLASRDRLWQSRCWALTSIVDRIGSGDAFAAGLLHGLDDGDDHAAALEFAVAAASLKHSIPGDANLARVDEIVALLADGGFGVRR